MGSAGPQGKPGIPGVPGNPGVAGPVPDIQPALNQLQLTSGLEFIFLGLFLTSKETIIGIFSNPMLNSRVIISIKSISILFIVR